MTEDFSNNRDAYNPNIPAQNQNMQSYDAQQIRPMQSRPAPTIKWNDIIGTQADKSESREEMQSATNRIETSQTIVTSRPIATSQPVNNQQKTAADVQTSSIEPLQKSDASAWIPQRAVTNQNTNISQNKNMLQCWAEALRRMTEFEGRSSKYEFWAFQSVSLVIFLFAALVGYFLDETKMVTDIFAVYFLLPATSSSVRRLHDISMSGGWVLPMVMLALSSLICWNLGMHNMVLLLFFTLTYVTYLCWLLKQDGDEKDNKYGAKISESALCQINGRAFVSFIMTFICGLWIIFAAYLFKF